MANLDRVTITGADDRTSIPRLIQLAEKYPFVEWGILMSPRHQGSPRFPSAEWIKRLAKARARLKGDFEDPPRISLHLCGGYVRPFLAKGENPSEWDHQEIWDVAQRVQFNFHTEYHEMDWDAFAQKIFKYPDLSFIYQIDGTPYNEDHFKYAHDLDVTRSASPLYDLSGGAGIVPGTWPTASYKDMRGALIYHGYAGGLGPLSITEELPKIREAAGEAPYWIDMEGKVRTIEILDLQKVEQVLAICQDFIEHG